MGRTYRIYLAGESVLMCRHCGNHLAVSEGIISKVGKTLCSDAGGKPVHGLLYVGFDGSGIEYRLMLHVW